MGVGCWVFGGLEVGGTCLGVGSGLGVWALYKGLRFSCSWIEGVRLTSKWVLGFRC